MKITKRKLLFPIAILTTAFVSGGIAYALSSANFANSAATWAKANCTSAVASSKYNSVNGQKSIICYNYNKNAEQDDSIQKISSATQSITNSLPQLVDGSGKTLGVAFSGTRYYDANLKVFVQLGTDGNVADSNSTGFETQDCSGKPYATNINGYDGNRVYTNLLKNYLSKKYYKVDTSNPIIINLPSRITDRNGATCEQNTDWAHSTIQAWPMTEVVPSVSYPVALPLTIK